MFTLLEEKMYKLCQVSIYFAVSKDVPTEEKQIKLAKLENKLNFTCELHLQ